MKELVFFTHDHSYEMGTKLIESFCNNENNILYFPRNRNIMIGKDDLLSPQDYIDKINGELTVLEKLQKYYDIEDIYLYNEWEYGGRIDCGAKQIINFIFTIKKYSNKDTTIVIDHFEQNLHVLLASTFLQHLMYRDYKFKKLVISAYNKNVIQTCNRLTKNFNGGI